MSKPPLAHEMTRNEAIAQRFQQLTEETTLHGLPQLKRSNSRVKRVLWVLIMLVVGVIMCSHIAILVMSFVEKEINVEIKIQSARELPFPAVTICNSNPINKSALRKAAEEDPDLLRLLMLESDRTSSRARRSAPDSNQTSAPGSDEPQKDYTQKNNELDEDFQTEEEITRILSGLPEEKRVKIGYSDKEMLFQCRYNGRHCNITKHFRHFYNVFHGNCYTFNSATLEMERKTSTRTGRRYGLELAVNINQDEYLRAANELAGVLLLVHSPDMMPFPEDDGIMLLPGIFSIIGLRLNKIQRALPPIGDCMRNEIKTSDINVYEELYSVKYSKKACLKTCYQQHLIKSCHCATPYFPRHGSAFGNAEVNLCSIQPDSEEKICMDKINKEFADNTLECACPSICSEDIYLSSISTAQWPIVSATDEVIAELAFYYPDMFKEPENNTDPDYRSKIMLNNFLKVVVFYEDLNHEMVTEFRAYTEIKFLSDMGGTMGLWMGVSVLTIMEIMEFAATVLYYCITKKKDPPQADHTISKEHYNQWRMTQINQKFGVELYVPPGGGSEQ